MKTIAQIYAYKTTTHNNVVKLSSDVVLSEDKGVGVQSVVVNIDDHPSIEIYLDLEGTVYARVLDQNASPPVVLTIGKAETKVRR